MNFSAPTPTAKTVAGNLNTEDENSGRVRDTVVFGFSDTQQEKNREADNHPTAVGHCLSQGIVLLSMSVSGVAELFAAVSKGSMQEFKSCIESGTPFASAGSYGETSMHIALGRLKSKHHFTTNIIPSIGHVSRSLSTFWTTAQKRSHGGTSTAKRRSTTLRETIKPPQSVGFFSKTRTLLGIAITRRGYARCLITPILLKYDSVTLREMRYSPTAGPYGIGPLPGEQRGAVRDGAGPSETLPGQWKPKTCGRNRDWTRGAVRSELRRQSGIPRD